MRPEYQTGSTDPAVPDRACSELVAMWAWLQQQVLAFSGDREPSKGLQRARGHRGDPRSLPGERWCNRPMRGRGSGFLWVERRRECRRRFRMGSRLERGRSLVARPTGGCGRRC